jgi:tetratricopeptide (TPR) repeat protein
VDEDEDVKRALEPVFLYQTNAEKGEGKTLAKEFRVRAYPSFILLDANGEIIDRWVGYEKNFLIKTMEMVLSDLSTYKEKQERYDSNPSARDAAAMGRFSYSVEEYKEAVTYYTSARKMNDDPSVDYNYHIFESMYRGRADDDFTFEDITEAADNVMSSEATSQSHKLSTAMRITYLANEQDRLDIVAPYIEAGLKIVSSIDDPDAEEAYNRLMIDKALYVDRNKDEAIKYKRASMPEGWREKASQLNAFSWWCFENLVNLEEAEQLARKAVELAEPGRQRAQILDTLAEICNVLGNCTESVELMKLAVKEDPEWEYAQEQLVRFEEILASSE